MPKEAKEVKIGNVKIGTPLSSNVSRRTFISMFGRIVGLGTLVAHISPINLFTAECANAPADNCPSGASSQDSCSTKGSDHCPGGGDDVDICSTADPDNCPGGAANVDKCLGGGNNDSCPGDAPPADKCDSGHNNDDKCSGNLPSTDNCPSPGNNTSDQCEQPETTESDVCGPSGLKANDVCHTGKATDDNCTPTPGASGENYDQCPGGAGDSCPTVGAQEEDDKCSEGGLNIISDDCIETDPSKSGADVCDYINDDACINGTNTAKGEGGTDKCDGTGVGNMTLGSDQCTTGQDADDLCTSSENAGLYDQCPGGDSTVDHCGSLATGGNSSDFCDETKPNNDICDAEGGDACSSGEAPEDECLNGNDICNPATPTSDTCESGMPSEDECPGGSATHDICNPGVAGSDIPE